VCAVQVEIFTRCRSHILHDNIGNVFFTDKKNALNTGIHLHQHVTADYVFYNNICIQIIYGIILSSQVTCRNRFCSTIHCAGSSTTWPAGRCTRNTWRNARASCSYPLASRTCPRSSYHSPRNSPGRRRSRRLPTTTKIIITAQLLLISTLTAEITTKLWFDNNMT